MSVFGKGRGDFGPLRYRSHNLPPSDPKYLLAPITHRVFRVGLHLAILTTQFPALCTRHRARRPR